jgi:3-oxoacyl-[acyl-carrier protein] reductase
MDLGLKDKTALVGGASAGLGFAVARALFEEGARVAMCSRDKTRIDRVAGSLSDDTNRVLPVVCDLTRINEIRSLIAKVQDSFKDIDILVTNCGGPPAGTHDSIAEKEWEHAYNLTFMSAVRLIQGIIPGMKKRKFGRIIILSSISAKQPIDNLLLSNSYRAGLLGYAKTISRELAPQGITVNTVMPGYTRTERLDELAEGISSRTGQSKQEVFDSWIKTIPVGRLGKPEELGRFVAFLASEQAGYLTGTATAIDGGGMAGIL